MLSHCQTAVEKLLVINYSNSQAKKGTQYSINTVFKEKDGGILYFISFSPFWWKFWFLKKLKLYYFLHGEGEGEDLSLYKSICKTILYLEVPLTKMKRQPEASLVCSGIVENTDKIKQPNTRRKLKKKEY